MSPPWFGRHVYADTRAIARKTAGSMWADHRCHRVQRYHGGLRRPALGRECERWANYGYSSCKFDRNIAASGNAPSTHAYSSADSTTFTTGDLRPPLLVARCRAGAPNAERSERTADIGESRIRASLIGEWICLPPVALFACCPDSGIRASLIGEWNRLPPTGVFAYCPDSGIPASLIGEWILLPPVALFACCPDSGIRASLIGEWISLPPVALFACCPDSGFRASLIGEWICLPPVGLFACCPDSGIGASLIGEWICLPPVALFAC